MYSCGLCMLNEFNSICIYLERDSFGAPWWEDTQDFLLGENPAISLEGIRWWVLKSCFSNFKCHDQRKTADTNAAAVAVQGSWSLMGSTFLFPMKNQDIFGATGNLKFQEKLFLSSHRILLPLVWAFCSDTNLAFTHGLIICNSKLLFTFLSFLVCFLDLLGPIWSFLACVVPTPRFFFHRWHLKAMGSPEREGHCQCPGFVVCVFKLASWS